MKISINWLSDYIDLTGVSVPQVVHALTDIGLEVEAVEAATGLPSEIVVGEVLSAVRHPNADQLQVCQVGVGVGEPLTIVCGAPNARAGLKVAVAQVGAVLPGDFKIKKSKIRGETSHGMLCSEKELGLSEEHQGILELPPEAPLGMPVAEALGLADSVLEIKVTPNRADCLSYVGIARDLAAKLARGLREPFGGGGARDAAVGQLVQRLTELESVPVTIHDEGECGRFVSLLIRGVKSEPSPEWMQKRLLASGMRPINLIVDATNYVMLEYGQPTHAYDLRFLRGGQLGVRALEQSCTFVTLDGQSRTLEPGDLVIVDGEGPVGIAGIMGGAATEVREDTSDVVLEVAAFSRTHIRKTAKRLGLQSEASYRFERGTDWGALMMVALRVASLIKGAALGNKVLGDLDLGGTLFQETVATGLGGLRDLFPGRGKPRVVAVCLSFVKQMLPQNPPLTGQQVISILERLRLRYLDGNEDRLVFEVPSHRHDLEREIDLVEEIARINGYDRVIEQLPVMGIKPQLEHPLIEFLDEIRTVVAGRGVVETVSFPFSATEDYESLGILPGHPLWPQIELQNPMSEKFRWMPTTLVPLLLRATTANRSRGDHGGRLFEVGRGYFPPLRILRGRLGSKSPRESDKKDAPNPWKGLSASSSHISFRAQEDQDRFEERFWLTILLDQPRAQKSWQGGDSRVDFFAAKKLVAEIFESFGLRKLAWVVPEADDLPFLHPGRSAWVYGSGGAGAPLGYVGELHPRAATQWGWETDSPLVVELNVDQFFRKVQGERTGGRGLQHGFSKFPGTSRDVAFLCDRSLTHGQFVATMEQFKARRFLESWELFDCYEGSHVELGKKSLGYRFYFRASDKTLTDQEIDSEVTQIIQWLGSRLGVSQR